MKNLKLALLKFANDLLEHMENAASGSTFTSSGFLNPEIRKKLLGNRGHSEEDVSKAGRLITDHGSVASVQARADAEIMENIKGNTSLGKVFRDMADIETKMYKARLHGIASRAKKILDREKREWEHDHFVPGGEIGKWSSPEEIKEYWDYREHEIKETESHGLKLYRKTDGSGRKDLESWTVYEEGADMSPLSGGRRLSPDLAKTFDELLKEGYRVLSGFTRMVGASGEGEILLVKL